MAVLLSRAGGILDRITYRGLVIVRRFYSSDLPLLHSPREDVIVSRMGMKKSGDVRRGQGVGGGPRCIFRGKALHTQGFITEKARQAREIFRQRLASIVGWKASDIKDGDVIEFAFRGEDNTRAYLAERGWWDGAHTGQSQKPRSHGKVKNG